MTAASFGEYINVYLICLFSPMKKPFLLVVFMAIGSIAIAQDFNQYKTLLPEGPIPKDFRELSSEKVAAEITNISDKKARVKRTKKKFVLESTFSIDGFLASGTVLFNDEVSLYLGNVLDEVLKSNPDLRKKIRIYAAKSTLVNAFTTNSGHIFVNLGLLARLENEAQLAFVLSHEAIHFQKQHVMNAYVANIEMDQGRGDYRKLKVNEKDFAKSSYSKELEAEADLFGADIYAASAYAKDSVERIFDILKWADLPLMYTTFDKSVFEAGAYVFPDSFLIEKGKELDINEDYDDSALTHPNIKKRKESVGAKFRSGTGGVDFKISKQRFYNVRKIARYELCRSLLLEHRYVEAVALALSLQKENPRSSYLRESIAKAFYGLARQQLRNEDAKIMNDGWAGEVERLAMFLKQQSPYELSVLALRQLYQCKEATPDNAEISMMLSDLMKAVALKYEDVPANFLRKSSQKNLTDIPYSYTQYAFIDFKNEADLFQQFERQASEAAKKEPSVSPKKRKSVSQRSLKVDKLVVVKPVYKKVDSRKKQRVRHIEAEEVLININDKINAAGNKLGMKTEVINPNKLSLTQVEIMRSNSIINDWFDEHLRVDDERQISPVYNEVMALATKYKTDHFAWMGALTLRHKNYGKGFAVFYSLILPSLAPFALVHIFKPSGKTLYFALVFNVRTQELELVDIRSMVMKDNESLLQSNIYYTLSKLKK
jgi:Zn-dependent protease with chaperone function